LAECSDIAVPVPVMRRVVVEMGYRQHDTGHPDRRIPGQGRRGGPAAFAVPPDLPFLVPPAAITQAAYRLTMRPTTDLAAP
jgi:hypothetical protein